VSIGAQSSTIGVQLRDAIARLKIARGAKPEWQIEWNRRF